MWVCMPRQLIEHATLNRIKDLIGEKPNNVLPIFSEVTHLVRFVLTLSMIFLILRGSKRDKIASRSLSEIVELKINSWNWIRSGIEPEIQSPMIPFKNLHALFNAFFLLVIECSIIKSSWTCLISTWSLVRLFYKIEKNTMLVTSLCRLLNDGEHL